MTVQIVRPARQRDGKALKPLTSNNLRGVLRYHTRFTEVERIARRPRLLRAVLAMPGGVPSFKLEWDDGAHAISSFADWRVMHDFFQSRIKGPCAIAAWSQAWLLDFTPENVKRWTLACIKAENESAGHYFFSRDTMKSSRDTMKSFSVRHERGRVFIVRVRPMRDRDGRDMGDMGGVGDTREFNPLTGDISSPIRAEERAA